MIWLVQFKQADSDLDVNTFSAASLTFNHTTAVVHWPGLHVQTTSILLNCSQLHPSSLSLYIPSAFVSQWGYFCKHQARRTQRARGEQEDDRGTNAGTVVSDTVETPSHRGGMWVWRGMERGEKLIARVEEIGGTGWGREREREALGIKGKGGGTRPADSWVTTHHSDGFTFALNWKSFTSVLLNYSVTCPVVTIAHGFWHIQEKWKATELQPSEAKLSGWPV